MQNMGRTQSWQSALILLSNTVVGLGLLAFLYLARMILIPFVLAIIFTFLLTPCVRLLQKYKLGRTPAVMLVAVMVAMLLGGSVAMISIEVKSLADELPSYSENLMAKIRHIRSMNEGSTIGRLEKLGSEIVREWHLKPGVSRLSLVRQSGTTQDAEVDPASPPAVVAQPQSQAWIAQVSEWLNPAFTNLSHIAMALVLAMFMLLKREALRNRFLRLLGDDPVTTATKAVDDASQRISRYLLMQFVVNVSYGMAWGIGLYVIGLNYFIFWAFLSAGLRYIPYLGATIGAMLPIAFSLVQFEGWGPTFYIIVLCLVLELFCNNVLEPWLYGHSIGVSAVALLISSAFWAFLWGPIGLILAAPLTVCLIVVGEQVPRLNFLVLLLGDLPVLGANVRFYQRLIASDVAEASSIISEQLVFKTPTEVYEEVILPALIYAKRESDRGTLSAKDEKSVLDEIREILERPDLKSGVEEERAEYSATIHPTRGRFSILAYPAQDSQDHLALELLRRMLDREYWDMQIATPDTLVSELLEDVVQIEPALIVIASLPAGGITQTRYACRKILERNSAARIVIGRWGIPGELEEDLQKLSVGGSISIGTTLSESLKQINTWYPIIADEEHGKLRKAE